MLQKLKRFCFSTKPHEIMDDVICDGRKFMKHVRGEL